MASSVSGGEEGVEQIEDFWEVNSNIRWKGFRKFTIEDVILAIQNLLDKFDRATVFIEEVEEREKNAVSEKKKKKKAERKKHQNQKKQKKLTREQQR